MVTSGQDWKWRIIMRRLRSQAGYDFHIRQQVFKRSLRRCMTSIKPALSSLNGESYKTMNETKLEKPALGIDRRRKLLKIDLLLYSFFSRVHFPSKHFACRLLFPSVTWYHVKAPNISTSSQQAIINRRYPSSLADAAKRTTHHA